MERFEPADTRLVFGIALCVRYFSNVKIIDKSKKTVADRIAELVRLRCVEHTEQLIKEINGALMEVRKGILRTIDHEHQGTTNLTESRNEAGA